MFFFGQKADCKITMTFWSTLEDGNCIQLRAPAGVLFEMFFLVIVFLYTIKFLLTKKGIWPQNLIIITMTGGSLINLEKWQMCPVSGTGQCYATSALTYLHSRAFFFHWATVFTGATVFTRITVSTGYCFHWATITTRVTVFTLPAVFIGYHFHWSLFSVVHCLLLYASCNTSMICSLNCWQSSQMKWAPFKWTTQYCNSSDCRALRCYSDESSFTQLVLPCSSLQCFGLQRSSQHCFEHSFNFTQCVLFTDAH